MLHISNLIYKDGLAFLFTQLKTNNSIFTSKDGPALRCQLSCKLRRRYDFNLSFDIAAFIAHGFILFSVGARIWDALNPRHGWTCCSCCVNFLHLQQVPPLSLSPTLLSSWHAHHYHLEQYSHPPGLTTTWLHGLVLPPSGAFLFAVAGSILECTGENPFLCLDLKLTENVQNAILESKSVTLEYFQCC